MLELGSLLGVIAVVSIRLLMRRNMLIYTVLVRIHVLLMVGRLEVIAAGA